MTNNYDACILEYKIHAEYQQLIKHQIPNLYVIPSANSSFIWYGVLFLHHGIYEGGVFRFTLFIPDNFDCPRVIFNPSVFHPMIHPETGEFDVKQYISSWKKNIHHIYHVLFYVREIFLQIDAKHCLNKEAARLYENDLEAYKQHVKQCIDDSNRKLYDNPPKNSDDQHAIKFVHLDDDAYDEVKREMAEFNKKNTPSSPSSQPSDLLKLSKC